MHKRPLLLGGRTDFRRMTLELLIVSTTLSIAVSLFSELCLSSAPAAHFYVLDAVLVVDRTNMCTQVLEILTPLLFALMNTCVRCSCRLHTTAVPAGSVQQLI